MTSATPLALAGVCEQVSTAAGARAWLMSEVYGRQTLLRPIIRAAQAIAGRNALSQLGLVLESPDEAAGADGDSP